MIRRQFLTIVIIMLTTISYAKDHKSFTWGIPRIDKEIGKIQKGNIYFLDSKYATSTIVAAAINHYNKDNTIFSLPTRYHESNSISENFLTQNDIDNISKIDYDIILLPNLCNINEDMEEKLKLITTKSNAAIIWYTKNNNDAKKIPNTKVLAFKDGKYKLK